MNKPIIKYYQKQFRDRKIDNIIIDCKCGHRLHRIMLNGPIKLKELKELEFKCLFCRTEYQFLEERGKTWQNIKKTIAKIVDKLIFWNKRDASKDKGEEGVNMSPPPDPEFYN